MTFYKYNKNIIIITLLLIIVMISSCSVKKMAVNAIAKNMSGSESANVFLSDNDPVLVGDSLPVILKMMDMMVSINPDNTNILSNAGSLFVMYGNAYIQSPASMLSYDEWEEQKKMYDRAKKHYLRGYDYLMKSLELRHSGFCENLKNNDAEKAFEKFKASDAADLYWASAAVLAGCSADVMDPIFASKRQEAVNMLFKACELNPDFGDGMLDELLMLYYASMPAGMGGDMEKALYHFNHGIKLSEGNLLSIYVSYAASICTKNQTAEGYNEFRDVLNRVLDKDPEQISANRLSNILAQEKAQWLLETIDDYFLIGF